MGGGGQDDMLLQYLMEMGAMQPEQENIARKRMMVDALRQQSQVPQGVTNQGGRGYQPARSPLESIVAPAMGQGLASYQEGGANAASQALKMQRMQALQRMRGGMGGGMGGMQFPQQPMPGEDTQPF
jgi:hypothetical protein